MRWVDQRRKPWRMPFLAFDTGPAALAGVFRRANGTFCAGADLKAMVELTRGNRLNATWDELMVRPID